VSTELRVTLPGPEGSGDARRSLFVLERLVTLLGQLEDVALDGHKPRADERSRWAFSNLKLGSLVATLAPSRPQRGATSDLLGRIAEWAVDGFAASEERPDVPPHWDRTAAATAVELANVLGLLPDDGVLVELLSDGEPVRSVTVTRHTAEHLTAGLRERRRSIGSVVGHLDSVTVHDRREAGLWPSVGGERVPVYFGDGHVDVIRAALGNRVEVSGTLTRDAAGRLLSVRLRDLAVLADEGPPVTALAGLDPGITGGLTPTDYLREIRGAS
jgi:hypothetical protein